MRRPVDFGVTVKYGRRVTQPDIVIHAVGRGAPEVRDRDVSTPLVGLIVGKSVGPAVRRHRVARRLRHAAYDLLSELEPTDRVVIRALPGSDQVKWGCLKQQLKSGLQVIRRSEGADR